MLNFILFMIFSGLETYALFLLAFKIFKIDIYHKEIVFSSIIMGFISYVLRYDYGLLMTDIVLQYLLTFSFMWLLFRIHVFYAAIMTGLAYLTYMLIQSSCYLLMNATGLYALDFPFVTSGIYLLQTVSATITILIASYVSKRRKGFDFVPDKQNDKVKIRSREIVIFFLSVPSLLIVLLMIYLSEQFTNFFYLMPLAYGILLYGYLYISYKKDLNENDIISL